MKILDEALKPIEKFFVEQGPGVNYIRGPIDDTCMMRLDWELAYDGTQEGLDKILNDRTNTASLMLEFMKIDLEDLIVNGDMANDSDVLYKMLDGEKKTGKKAVDVLIPHASYYQEVKPKKNSVEFTVYFRFGIVY